MESIDILYDEPASDIILHGTMGVTDLSLVPVQKLKEGWILGEDARDINGRLILRKGCELKSNHIKIFKVWGVSDVEITQETDPIIYDGDDKDSEKLHAVEHTVKMIMQNIDIRHPIMHEIFRTAVEHRYRKGLIVELENRRPLPPNFKLDLSSGLRTQIEFSDIKLPDAPEIILEYNKVHEDPSSSINDIADVVNRSPSLAALLLKVVNSAFYGFPSRIDTISRAVTLVGTREIGSLILGISIMGHFRNISKELIDMSTFIRHSLSCAILARILAASNRMQHTEQLFVSGLLHDIGRLVWYKYFPEQAKLLLKMAKKTGNSLFEIENGCMGISHEQIATHLLGKWKFPASLENSILYHHCPSKSPDPLEAGIIHIADIAINAIGLGHSGERILPGFEAEVWDKIQVAPNSFKTAMDQTIEQLDIMETIFSEL